MRYYEKLGLIDPVDRDASSGHRRYDPATVTRIESLANLRAVGLSIEDMSTQMHSRGHAPETIATKLALLVAHNAEITREIGRLKARRRFLDNRNWCHPYDEKGARQGFDDIPASLTKLKDDPYRSLAGELRHAGGYAKDLTPFSEFLWADFLRTRIRSKVIAADFDKALDRAVKLARSKEAVFLPGWCGPDPIG